MKKPIEIMLDQVDWKPIGDGAIAGDVPIATHEGVLKFGPLELRVFQLSDGQRVIDKDDLIHFFSALGGSEDVERQGSRGVE